MAVDGKALTTSVLAQVSEPNVTFERDELQKKLDKREIDLTRKEKELHKCELEVFRLQKEAKLAAAENQNLRERNETLQQSLMNARLLSQSARDEAANAANQNRIRELESALSAAIHKIKKAEVELNTWQQKWKDADHLAQELSHELQTIKANKNDDKDMIATLNAKLKAANAFSGKLEDEMEKLKQEMALQGQQMKEVRARIEKKDMDLDQKARDLAEAKAETSKYKTLLQVRSETNSALRSQLEEISGNSFTISKEEMNRYKAQELELKGEKLKLGQLNRSLDLHMDLLHKAEMEAGEAVEKRQVLEEEVSKLNLDIFELRKRVGGTGEREKVLKKEVIKLRKQAKELERTVKELEMDPHSHDTEILQMRQALAGTNKSRLDELEGKQKESKRRKIAEESLSALRSRIAFLLEQLEAASEMATKWQQQKSILRTEVESLQNVNVELRKRLTQVQSHYMNRGIAGLVHGEAFNETKTAEGLPSTQRALANSPYSKGGATAGQQSPRGSAVAPGDVLSGRVDAPVSSLGEYYQNPAASAVVPSVEAVVERALFDAVCAFSSGTREQKVTNREGSHSGFKKSKGKMTQKPIFKVQPVKDQPGKFEVVSLGSNDDVVDTSANELLVSTHINSFLNFCQSRPVDRSASLYSEKIAHLLNFIHHTEQDMVDQLATSRMEQAQLASRVEVNDNRVNRLRLRYSSERAAKQKSIMKAVRELMRMSDVRILFERLNEGSKTSKMDLIETGLSLQTEMKSTNELLDQVELMAEELSKVGTGGKVTGAVGSLEIRLPECELDDETLFGAMGLLSGGIEDSSAMRTLRPLQLGVSGDDPDAGEETTDPDDPMERTGTMMMSKDLARAVVEVSKDYQSRIITMNLRGNLLTGISCKTLSSLVERSGVLRFIDLRDNAIGEKGIKIMFDSARKNRSIMYVTQRQNGSMIEGHRELGSRRQVVPGETAAERPDSDNPNFSLRIDIRNQEAKVGDVTDTMFEQVDYSHFKHKHPEAFEPGAAGGAPGGFSPGPYSPGPGGPGGSTWGMGSPGGPNTPYGAMSPGGYPTSPGMHDFEATAKKGQGGYTVSWGSSGIIKQVEQELANKDNMTKKAGGSVLQRLNQDILDADRERDGTNAQRPPRPHSASGAVTTQGDLRIGMGAKEAFREDFDDGSVVGDAGSIVVASPRGAMRPDKAPGGNADLINLIESGASAEGKDNVGGFVDNELRHGGTVGSFLDKEIRDMEQKGQVEKGRLSSDVMDSPYSGHDIIGGTTGTKKAKKVSVKTRILTDTKRIYNNKKAFGDLDIPDEAEKLRMSASSRNSKSAESETSKMLSSIPMPLDRGGGSASRAAASSVSRRLSADRERAKTAPSSRPGSDKARGTPSKGSTGGKQLSSLQKLNPSTLF